MPPEPAPEPSAAGSARSAPSASASGPAPAPPAETVAALVRSRAGDPNPGLRFEDRAWTWAEVVTEMEVRAGLLAELVGAAEPPHVGVLLDNVPEYLFTLGGAALSGTVVVGINPTRRGEELARDIRHVDCRAIVTDPEHADLLDGLDLGVAGDRIVLAGTSAHEVLLAAHRAARDARTGTPPSGVADRHVPVGGPAPDAVLDPRRPVVASEPDAAPPVASGPVAEPGPEDLLLLIFTSGSTGAPKAVRMTQGRAARSATRMGFRPRDVLYCAIPVFHGNALSSMVFPALATGASLVFRRRFSASGFLPDVREHGCTFTSTVGRALSYVLATPPSEHDRDHRLKFVLAPESSSEDVRRFTERFGPPVFGGYGSSENAIVMVPAPDQPPDVLGVPAPGIEVAVVDPATEQECPRARFDADGRLLNPDEAIGELVGLNVLDRFEGYYDNAEAEAERTRSGWYWSGDLAYRDEQDVFHFAGRTADWLRVDGENFAAAPVERVLQRFPAVSAAAVVGVPDEQTVDDQVLAVVELVPGATFDPAAFDAFLAEQRDLGTKWSPRYVRVVPALPVTATDKVDKAPLRRVLWNGTGDDAVYWRPRRRDPLRPLTAADRDDLHARFAAHGRAEVLAR